MSDRDDNRKWLHEGAERDPDGWEAGIMEDFGEEGALDLLALQGGQVWDVDLRHSPFRRDPELKFLTREAQLAVNALSRRAYEVWWNASEERRARRDLGNGLVG